MEIITSLQNPKIKQALKLWKRGERKEKDLFLIEGFRELTRAAKSSVQLTTLFICPNLFLGTHEEELIAQIKAQGATIIRCSEVVFKKLSYRDRPDGLIAIAKQFHFSLTHLKAKKQPLYVVAEGIEKPGNLGTILRSSDATGVDGVLVSDKQTDIHNPNVVRASVGTLFTIPVIEADGKEIFDWLKNQKIAIIATTPAAQTLFTDVDLKGPAAIIVGAEQFGLSPRWLKGADIQVKIPMLGVADSLNVAMAATLLLYEAVRQRNSYSNS